MTYETARYGFDSIRIVPSVPAQTFAPAVSDNAVTGNVVTRPGTIHHVIVELPDLVLADTIELHDVANVNLVTAATLVTILRPWGVAVDGSYHIPVHRQFLQGMVIVRSATSTSGITVMYGVMGHRMPNNADNFIQRR